MINLETVNIEQLVELAKLSRKAQKLIAVWLIFLGNKDRITVAVFRGGPYNE